MLLHSSYRELGQQHGIHFAIGPDGKPQVRLEKHPQPAPSISLGSAAPQPGSATVSVEREGTENEMDAALRELETSGRIRIARASL